MGGGKGWQEVRRLKGKCDIRKLAAEYGCAEVGELVVANRALVRTGAPDYAGARRVLESIKRGGSAAESSSSSTTASNRKVHTQVEATVRVVSNSKGAAAQSLLTKRSAVSVPAVVASVAPPTKAVRSETSATRGGAIY